MINNSKVAFIIHTSFVSVEDLNNLFKELMPEVKVNNIVDDSLLAEVLRFGKPTELVKQKMCGYFVDAARSGADLILNQCSSVGEVAELASNLVDVPLLRVDRRMAERACETGKRIGVVATLETTLGPTCRLVKRVASEMNIDIELYETLCEGAFQKLISGDRKGHNSLIIDYIKKLSNEVDVILCAQGSMVALLDDLKNENIKVPVMTSLRMGVEQSIEILKSM